VEVLVMNILGIETSCDETACAVVKDGREVLANVVYTQIPLHQPYGGVVPEVASRAHIEKIHGVVKEAMRAPVDAVAVTYGPGLASSLLVGLNAAKGLALSLGVPLIGVNHIEAHLHTPFLFDAGSTGAANMGGSRSCATVPAPESSMPALGLAVSGGHTTWMDMPAYGEYWIIGQTLDDAAGEAFDKAAKLLGLGYPGGLKIDRMSADYVAKVGRADLIPFPKGRPREGVSALAGLPAEMCVSFSGLKTALLRYVQKNPSAVSPQEVPRVVASYQEAIVRALADCTKSAFRRKRYKTFVLGGGVSLNSRVREVLSSVCKDAGVRILMAKPKYTGDNGAMIAGLAHLRRNHVEDAMTIDANPSLQVGD
jgi:N6-L-threonylcarbamoyladenine synthase